MKPKKELTELGARPKKHFGQNFLRDEKVLADIVLAGKLEPTDTVVEIGPGLGALTFELAKAAKRVIAIEADRDLADELRRKVPRNVTIITGDALRVDWAIDILGSYKIIANIPYSITSPLLRKIFSLEHKPELVVLLVQKELAERITAPAGDNARGFLTLLVEANATAKIIRTVKPGSFYPAPTVDSAVIKLVPRPSRQAELFWPIVESAFAHKRQTLANGIFGVLVRPKKEVEEIITSLGINTLARPADLSFEDWKNLSEKLEK